MHRCFSYVKPPRLLGWLGVCDEVPVDDVGESSFEESDGFSLGRSRFDSSFDECLCPWVDAHLGDRDAVERCVGLPVSSPVEPEPGVVV
jgi:hypothetical protein